MVLWNGSGSTHAGKWTIGANWDGSDAPQDGDEVVLPDYPGGYTVTIGRPGIADIFSVETHSTAADPIVLDVTDGVSFAPEGGIAQDTTGTTVRLSRASSFTFNGAAFGPSTLNDPQAPDVAFADGTASRFAPALMGYAAIFTPATPDAYRGRISGFGGRNVIATGPVNATTYFTYAPGAAAGVLTLHQPGLDPFDQTGGVVLVTALSGILNFSGSYSQSDFRLTYDPTSATGVGVITYVAQTSAATGPNIVQGTGGNDALAVTGRFKTVYGNGGNDVVTLTGDNGQVLIGNSAATTEQVTLAGTHDTVQGSGGSVTVRGGAGSNTFILGDGGTTTARYDLSVGGAYNKFVLDDHATNIVVAGGSGADLAIGGRGDGARGSATVTLAGLNNVVNVGDGDAVVTGGDGFATMDFGAGTVRVTTAGNYNRLAFGAGEATVDPGGHHAIVSLDGTAATLALHGWGNLLSVQGGASGLVAGGGSCVEIDLLGVIGSIRVARGVSAYVEGAYAGDRWVSDGAGGQILYTHGGSIDLLGAAPV